ncbi:unnamed protein product [Clavelina lepadiformis]|uniref:Uncharacterized protein n=1 Tax=Clavelina lepadiformis TaxID=159417 RepID=A0ABP0FZR2_CLALP
MWVALVDTWDWETVLFHQVIHAPVINTKPQLARFFSYKNNGAGPRGCGCANQALLLHFREDFFHLALVSRGYSTMRLSHRGASPNVDMVFYQVGFT